MTYPARWRRPAGDDGAIAVLTALLTALLLLPLTGLALGAYVRGGTQAELGRAADSGALAGAAALPLLNPGPLGNLSTAELTALLLEQGDNDQVAFTTACRAALAAAAADGRLSSSFVTGGPTPTCTAGYSPDSTLGPCVGSILGVINAVDQQLTLLGVPAQVGGVVSPLTSLVTSLLPALLHNGVRVTLTWEAQGPVDGVAGVDPDQQTAVATARRRFNALLPAGLLAYLDAQTGPITQLLPRLPGGIVVDPSTATLVRQLQLVLEQLKTFVLTTVPSACGAAVGEVLDDLSDALRPDPRPGFQQVECLALQLYAVAGIPPGQSLLGVPLPDLGLPGLPGLPVLPPSLNPIGTSCLSTGLFRAQLAP